MNEDKRIAAPSSNDELSIDLYSIFLDVSKEWLSIFLLTVSVVLISYVVLTNLRTARRGSPVFLRARRLKKQLPKNWG